MNPLTLFKKKEREETPEEKEAYEAALKAYYEELKIRRIENAKKKAAIDAGKIFNYQPFYKKLLSGGKWLIQDLSEGAAKTRPEVFFNMDDETPPRKRKKH